MFYVVRICDKITIFFSVTLNVSVAYCGKMLAQEHN